MTSPCQTCGAAFEPCYCNAPVVCPGCYSVGDEPCAPDCIDAEIAAEADDFDDDDSCIRDDSTECDCSRCCEDQARWESWQGWDCDDDYMGGFCTERGCTNYALDGYSRCATCIAERAIAKEST